MAFLTLLLLFLPLKKNFATAANSVYNSKYRPKNRLWGQQPTHHNVEKMRKL
jgi:hypothetical protein